MIQATYIFSWIHNQQMLKWRNIIFTERSDIEKDEGILEKKNTSRLELV